VSSSRETGVNPTDSILAPVRKGLESGTTFRPTRQTPFCGKIPSKINKRSMNMAKRLYFFWDYDLTDDDVQKILASDNEMEKVWVMSRILQSARWEDIWKYVTPDDIRQNFEKLQFRTPHLRDLWHYALTIWRQPNEE
jgi:hypothetical protein